MASDPNPKTVFSNRFLLSKDATTGALSIQKDGYSGTFSAIDTADAGKTDSPTQLGDVQSDRFTGNDGTRDFNRIYFGQTQDGKGLVALGTGGKATYFLYTNNSTYAVGDPVTPVKQPFALCFGSGTRIGTARGDVAVEDLRVGDRAVTAGGAQRTITWIGHRRIDGRGQPLATDQSPVRVRAGAFGPGLPARDLQLSPGHPVLVGADADHDGGVLVPVMCLINGTTIARVVSEAVTYWHVELESHDILLAEGLPAESYLDLGCRAFFEDGSDAVLHDPDLVASGAAGRCRPVALDGPLVEAERARLDAVFAAALDAHCAWAGTNAPAILAA